MTSEPKSPLHFNPELDPLDEVSAFYAFYLYEGTNDIKKLKILWYDQVSDDDKQCFANDFDIYPFPLKTTEDYKTFWGLARAIFRYAMLMPTNIHPMTQ